jgi:Asp/Glu/hydantoin racemase
LKRRLAYIHTVTTLPAMFKALSSELIPEVDVFNIVDESLLQNTIRENQLSHATRRRLVGYVASAREAGADLVMVTCSSLGPAVDTAALLFNMPVLRVDQPMADLAVQTGKRIGVAATLKTTLDPTTALVSARANAAGKQVEITAKLCEGAFEAVVSGDTERHDALVKAGLRELTASVDVVVLAQASMARVVDLLSEEERRIPILSSPRLAVEYLAKMIPTM